MRVLVGTSHSNKNGAEGSWGPIPQVHPATPAWSLAQVRKEGSISVGEDSRQLVAAALPAFDLPSKSGRPAPSCREDAARAPETLAPAMQGGVRRRPPTGRRRPRRRPESSRLRGLVCARGALYSMVRAALCAAWFTVPAADLHTLRPCWLVVCVTRPLSWRLFQPLKTKRFVVEVALWVCFVGFVIALVRASLLQVSSTG